jgi:hypothetical protein
MLAPYQNPAMVSHPTPSSQEVDTGLVCLLILARSRHNFEAAWNGTLMLLTTRSPLRSTARKFNVTWFLPAILTYRKLLGEVLLASFFLQLFALLTPLFFQVVTDKILVHKGITTLRRRWRWRRPCNAAGTSNWPLRSTICCVVS